MNEIVSSAKKDENRSWYWFSTARKGLNKYHAMQRRKKLNKSSVEQNNLWIREFFKLSHLYTSIFVSINDVLCRPSRLNDRKWMWNDFFREFYNKYCDEMERGLVFSRFKWLLCLWFIAFPLFLLFTHKAHEYKKKYVEFL